MRVESKLGNLLLYALLQSLLFRWHVDHLNEALHTVSAVLIASNLPYMRLQDGEDPQPLRRRRALQKPLAEVVSILVTHELVNVMETLIYSKGDELWACFGQKLLKLFAAQLVLGHLYDFTVELPKALKTSAVVGGAL